jgi:glycosyltransferase involved in cell wall biosynthesis
MSWVRGLHWFHVSEFWRGVIQLVAWAIAGLWALRVSELVMKLPSVADLTGLEWDVAPSNAATLTVVVPAKDEAENIAATCEALLAADYERLKIVCVDDRSTDATGTIMDESAERSAGRMKVIHITELPEGWMGKTFAMAVATDNSESEWVLYTDADVLFSPSILRRALAYAEASDAEHLVVVPTMQVKSRGEGLVLGFMQVLGIWASRPWRVADATSQRDTVGIGAFNLLRRAALEEMGGWAPQRLAVLEDITLGRRVKAAGLKQRVAFAPGLVLVHWAAGARGLMHVMTKNFFSAFNFKPVFALGAMVWIVVFCLGPLVGLLWVRTVLPSLLVLWCIAAVYRSVGSASGIDARYGWMYPLGAVAFLWAMVRSMFSVWRRGGVVWRGTHYALRDLRRHNSPFQWEREAAELRRMAKGKRV